MARITDIIIYNGPAATMPSTGLVEGMPLFTSDTHELHIATSATTTVAISMDGHTHTEYIEVDGTTPLTADWDAGAFEIRAETFESDVTTGTAPLTVASTTLVTNLNADTVDGYEGTELAVLAENETVTGTWDFDEITFGGNYKIAYNSGQNSLDISYIGV